MLSYSQNFINNQRLITQLLTFVDFQNANLVLEIGPGNGMITNHLIETKKKVIAIEADKELYLLLRAKYSSNTNLFLIHDDFLKYELPKEPFIVVSNIPFNITAEIIKKITASPSCIGAYLIMQKDAAFKFTGTPTGEFSLLSNFIRIHFNVHYLKSIPRFNFTPRPKFDAAFISVKKRKCPALENNKEINQFKDLLCYIFDRSKPLLKDALKTVFNNSQVKVILKDINRSPDISIKQVSFDNWISIYKTFAAYAPTKSKTTVYGSYVKLVQDQSKLQKNHRTRKY